MNARWIPRAGVAVALTVVTSMAFSQECLDRDGDDHTAGQSCVVDGDCEDGEWTIHPGAIELCDGFDSDCDGSLDQGCDTYCDQPVMTQLSTSIPGHPVFPDYGASDAVLFRDGILVCAGAYFFDSQNPNPPHQIVARRFDRFGTPLGPIEMIGRGGDPLPNEEFCQVASGGDRALVIWSEYEPGPEGSARIRGRMLDAWSRPVGSLIDASGPIGSAGTTSTPLVVWNGREFAIFWVSRENRRIFLTRVPVSYPTDQPTTTLIIDNVLDEARTVGDLTAAWVGDGYVLAFYSYRDPELSLTTLRVDQEGHPANAGVKLPFLGSPSALSAGGTSTLLAWLEGTTPYQQYGWYAFLDPATAAMLPPGRRPLPTSIPLTSSTFTPLIAWTGEMFAVSTYRLIFNGIGYDTEYWLWRVLPSGVNLDPSGNRISGPGPRFQLWELLWDGDNLSAIHTMKDGDLMRTRIACECTNADGDGRNACVDDCDDTNPAVARGRSEICTGGLDDDCDGLVDCRDSDCVAGSGPGEVSGVRWSGASQLNWQPQAGAQRYDIVRGLASDSLRRGDLGASECAALEVTTTSWTDDGRKPGSGDALWYLVRAEGSPCHAGPWGTEPQRSAITACY